MKGILFKPWKIKFIAESSPDRELQTRRVIKPQPAWYNIHVRHNLAHTLFVFHDLTNDRLHSEERKPRYQVGETVYVKEAWAEWINTSEHLSSGVISISEAQQDIIYKSDREDWDELLKQNGNPWTIKSTLFMPAWAARYFIKITGVGAGRLQEITIEDIWAEGCLSKNGTVTYFKDLWNSINPKYPWESNPWVFVYSFKRVEVEK